MPEPDDGYQAYVKYLYDRDIAPVLNQYPLRRHWMFWDENLDHPLGLLARADVIVRLVQASRDMYGTFRPEVLAAVIEDASSGVRANSRVLSELGFAETLDSEYKTLAQGVRLEYLPVDEVELLRRYGFPQVADNLPGILYMVREHAAAIGRYQEVPPVRELRNVEERLDQAAADHRRLAEIDEELVVLRRAEESNANAVQRLTQEAETKKKPRRWWKGLGQIIAGAGISLGDVAAAVGFGSAGVVPAWGALISVTVGVGTAMVGVGELRGE